MSDGPQTILALDLANLAGWALWAHSTTAYGVWNLTKSGNRLANLSDRIHDIACCNPELRLIAAEASSFGGRNPRVQQSLNELRGVTRLVAYRIGAEYVEFHPTTIKSFATGSGRATKDQMIRAAKTMLGVETDDDNIADALFILELAKRYGTNPLTAAAKKKARKRVKSKQARLF